MDNDSYRPTILLVEDPRSLTDLVDVWEAANRPEMMPRKPLATTELPPVQAAAPH